MFTPTDPNLFFTKNDLQDIRLGDLVLKKVETSKDHIITVIGYPDDEGIQLNGGRIGSAQAPDIIRRFLYKMTPPAEFNKILPTLIDAGNCSTEIALDQRHLLASAQVKSAYQKKHQVISLGGGHDYGYPDCEAFIEIFKKAHSKPVIINFDAHLDVRPNDKFNHSGTPFYRLKEKYKDQFHLIEIGLQPQCNSKAHWEWAKKNNIDLFSLEAIEKSNWLCASDYFQNISRDTPIFISFDMDALCSADAGGCSQAWPTGLKLKECLVFLKQIYSQYPVQGLGIYETSPPFDHDFKTSKAAALLAYQFIFN